MGSANSTIPAEPLFAAVAVAGVLGYGYVHYVRPSGADTDADTTNSSILGGVSKGSVLHGQKKRGRKLKLPGDATLKNLDFLDSPLPAAAVQPPAPPPAPVTRQRQPAAPPSQGDAVPGGFGGADASDEAPSTQQPEPSAEVKKPRKKRGNKKIASDPPADASTTAKTASVSTPAVVAMADAPQDERWTRVEARKRKPAVQPQDGLSKLQTVTTDATTSDAGITTSVTGNSSPVTERTTEDELPSGLDESAQALSAASLDAPSRVAPVRPLPGEQPAKGFAWDDYEGVQDASSEDDGGWGVVRSRRRPAKTESGSTVAAAAAPQQQTKKQRQNAQKREAQKEAKRERDAQQHDAFSSHKRELESARRADQAATSTKRTGSRYDSLDMP